MSRFFQALSDSLNNRPTDKRGVQPNNNRRPDKYKPLTQQNKKDKIEEECSWSITSSIVAVPSSKHASNTKKIIKSEPNLAATQVKKKSLFSKKAPTVKSSENITFRKGPSQASSSKTPGLRGASSISSLDSKHKVAPINPLKTNKLGSRDKLDKLSLQKSNQNYEKNKHEKGLTKNNNAPELPRLEAVGTVAALQELEVVQRELEEMAREKASLALELANQQTELQALRTEVARLKSYHDQQTVAMEQLSEENTSLRCRLRDVAHSPLSDNEKQQLLLDHRQHSSSAPASIATNFQGGDQNPGDTTTCPTPDWDKHSTSSLSEISVACLQDRIMQMQETHYSTNEELQATLQELSDLQSQLTELQQENERLAEEKGVLLESLCRQTEKLEDSRMEVDTLRQLLCKDREGEGESSTEREQKLVELLKNAQDERENLLLKQEVLNNDLQDTRQATHTQSVDISRLSDRIKLLESTLDATYAERKQLSDELNLSKEQSSSKNIEISTLNTLLDNARAKIAEMEQDRTNSDKSELDEMLDNARKEKDALESQVASLQEQLSLTQVECGRLKEQISILQEECKVTRNNAKCTQTDLEYSIDQLRQENTQMTSELSILKEAVGELQVQCQCHLEDKRQLKAVLNETQRCLGEVEARLKETETELDDEKRRRKEENSEWEQFQNDLLMTVRVANDFKTEAQQELQNLIIENKTLRDKFRQAESQLDKIKSQSAKPPTPPIRTPTLDFPTDIPLRRPLTSLSRQDSRLSVKSLIESIENATKHAKATGTSQTGNQSGGGTRESGGISGDSRSESMSSLCSNGSEDRRKIVMNEVYGKTEVSAGKLPNIGKTDDNLRESILHNTKAIDFTRRNSYSDLSERKDPLNGLVKNGGSKRNALLKWCQQKTVGYRNIDITNFSSSWNDGLALCALLHTYLPDRVPYDSLGPHEKRRNFSLAFQAAESVGINTTLNINDMIQLERPDWQQVMAYVTAIYKHFET